MNWKVLYRAATEEPISEFVVKFRIWLGLKIFPKPIRDLAVPLLETTTNLLHKAMKENKNGNFIIDVVLHDSNEKDSK